VSQSFDCVIVTTDFFQKKSLKHKKLLYNYKGYIYKNLMLKLSINFSLRFNLLTDNNNCKFKTKFMSDPLSLAAASNNDDNIEKYLISNDKNNNYNKKICHDAFINEQETSINEETTLPQPPIRTKYTNKQSNHLNNSKLSDNDDAKIDKSSVTIAPGSLQPNHTRWFYKEESNSTKWTPFKGYDSINLELEFRRNESPQNYETVQVLDSMYEVDIQSRKYYPIYWDGKY
jgi:hypothetical protein